jgi:hypothetical protein
VVEAAGAGALGQRSPDDQNRGWAGAMMQLPGGGDGGWPVAVPPGEPDELRKAAAALALAADHMDSAADGSRRGRVSPSEWWGPAADAHAGAVDALAAAVVHAADALSMGAQAMRDYAAALEEAQGVGRQAVALAGEGDALARGAMGFADQLSVSPSTAANAVHDQMTLTSMHNRAYDAQARAASVGAQAQDLAAAAAARAAAAFSEVAAMADVRAVRGLLDGLGGIVDGAFRDLAGWLGLKGAQADPFADATWNPFDNLVAGAAGVEGRTGDAAVQYGGLLRGPDGVIYQLVVPWATDGICPNGSAAFNEIGAAGAKAAAAPSDQGAASSVLEAEMDPPGWVTVATMGGEWDHGPKAGLLGTGVVLLGSAAGADMSAVPTADLGALNDMVIEPDGQPWLSPQAQSVPVVDGPPPSPVDAAKEGFVPTSHSSAVWADRSDADSYNRYARRQGLAPVPPDAFDRLNNGAQAVDNFVGGIGAAEHMNDGRTYLTQVMFQHDPQSGADRAFFRAYQVYDDPPSNKPMVAGVYALAGPDGKPQWRQMSFEDHPVAPTGAVSVPADNYQLLNREQALP